METTWIIILLTVIGLLLIGVDFFIPGFVLGTCGIFLMLGAVAIEFWTGGLTKAAGLFVVEVILGVGVGYLTIRYGSETAAAKRMILAHDQTGQRSAADFSPDLIGTEGRAHTVLRPTGLALFNGQRLDVVAESGMIDAGSTIKVVAVSGTKITVRKI